MAMVGQTLAWGSFVILVTAVLSRILGLIRESLIAYLFGAQAVTDSYIVASVLPTSIAGLIGGALTTVFISVFVEERERLGEAKAWEGARAVLGSSFLFLILMLGIAYGLVPF
ncbi:MAG: lipid II flippase MurJ, partial [Candidatus Methanomethyliaceae archaeon]